MKSKLPLVAGLLVLSLVAFVFLRGGDSTPPSHAAKPDLSRADEATLQPVETPTLAPSPRQGTTQDTPGVRTTVRRFLKDFLPYSHGRGKPEFKAATPEFRADLLSQYPNVPERIRKLKAHVTVLQVDYVQDNSAQAGAMVKDSEGAEYPVRVSLEKRDGRWYVSAVGG